MEPHQEVDTICAISTPPGVGGIAVARVSGPRAVSIVDAIWRGKRLEECESHTVHLGTVADSLGHPLDQAVATIYRAPRSFTGDDVVELAVHGSRWIQRELIASLCAAGCRMAEPGEFTRRAFASGKIDLAEAEGVADMIASTSRAAHRAAMTQMRGDYSRRIASLRDELINLASLLELELDFSEEEVEFASRSRLLEIAENLLAELSRLHVSFASGRAIKEGIPVAIVGPTNAGKSSLLNALTGDDRAIVSDIHGTTRDIVDDLIEIGDYRFRFQDTAGLRDTNDAIERIGIDRSRKAAADAAIILYMLDSSEEVSEADMEELQDLMVYVGQLYVVLNKIDIAPADAARKTVIDHYPCLRDNILEISTKQPKTIGFLTDKIISSVAGSYPQDDILVTNARHAEALGLAAAATARVVDGLRSGLSGDLIAQDLREVLHHLSTITGAITTPDLLATIFSRFCIGK